jgi:hypothetical protein
MFEPLPSLDILLVLNFVGHIQTGIVMQQNDAVSEFALLFVLELRAQLLKHLTVTVCIDCVVMCFIVTEVQTYWIGG